MLRHWKFKVWRDGRLLCWTSSGAVLAKINFMQSVSELGRPHRGLGRRFSWTFQAWAAAKQIKPSFASRPRRWMSTLLRGCPGAAAAHLTRDRSFTPMDSPTRAPRANPSSSWMRLSVMLGRHNMLVSIFQTFRLKLPEQIPRCRIGWSAHEVWIGNL